MNKKTMIIGLVLLYLFSTTMFVNPVAGDENGEFVDLDVDSDLVLVNNDDDDDNGTPDMYQNGSIPEEDDLILMILEIGFTQVRGPEPVPVPMIVNYTLTYPPKIRLWHSEHRGNFTEDNVSNNTLYQHEILILGDMNLDGYFNDFDNALFYTALGDPVEYMNQYGIDPAINGDINGDGKFDGGDISPFSDYLAGNELWYVPIRLWIEGLESSLQDIEITALADFGYQVTNDSDTVLITVPQLIIGAPSSITEGETFEVNITANDNPIDVEVTFDGNIYSTGPDGIVYLTAPQVEEDTEYNITASKEGYTSITTTIMILNIPDPDQLVIVAPPAVQEGESFQVNVTANSMPIENTQVKFNGQIKYTDNEGTTNFTAPQVDQDKEYLITASKDGYESANHTLTILNQELEIDKGWVYGLVSNGSGFLLEDASICVIISETSTKICTFADEKGSYHILVPTGAHRIEASKTGYQTSADMVTVKTNSAIQRDFILHEEEQEIVLEPSFQEEVIAYAIQTGKVGAEINVDDEEEHQITLYTNLNVKIEPRSSVSEFSFKISADNETPGTVFVLRIDNVDSFFNTDSLDINNIIFEFDGVPIEKADFNQVIDSEDENNTKWTGFFVGRTLYILGWVPHFSEHTITISSVVEAVGSVTVLALYIAIFVVLAVTTGIPMIRLWKKIE